MSHYSGKVRVRAIGICIINNQLLLVKHEPFGQLGYFWNPPGGGVSFGESVADTIVREFKEECNITVKPIRFLTWNEYISPEIHAEEIIFLTEYVEGNIELGTDPELENKPQLLKDIKLFTREQLAFLPSEAKHSLLNQEQFLDLIFENTSYKV